MKKVFLLLLLSVPAIFFLLRPGFYEPHDLHHVADIYEMYRAFQSGQLPPRLGPDFSFGYGYPLFNFYYLLPFYIGALSLTILGSLTASFKFVFIASAVFSVFGMYLFLKEFMGRWPALVGSFLYLYTPYRAVQIYVRGAMGEAVAMAILPFVAWSLIKVVKSPRSPVLIAAASGILGLFAISHNLFPFLSAPWLVFLVLLLLGIQKKKSEALRSLVAVALLAGGLSFYWWFPAVVEKSLVASSTPFKLEDHFPFVRQLIFPSWGYGSSVWGPGDQMSFQIGVVNLVVFVLFLGLLVFARNLFKKRSIRVVSAWTVVAFLISVFMMNIRSLPLWRLVPFSEFVQFPWRLLFMTTFTTAVGAAVTAQVLKKKLRIIFGALVILGSLVFTVSYFQPSQIFSKSDDDYLARFFALSDEYATYSEDYLLLPNSASERPGSLPASKIEVEDGVIKELEEVNLVSWRAKVFADKPTKITFYAYHFPGWFAQVDGEQVETSPGEPHGQIEIMVPEGEHEVEFFWKETRLRQTVDLVSLASLVFWLALFTAPIWRRR